MIGLKITVGSLKSLDKLEADVKKLEREFEDLTPLWGRLLMDLIQYEKALFANQGYGQWPFYTETFESPEAARRYMNWKGKHYPGTQAKLLVLSGALKESLTTPKAALRMTRKQFSFGTRVKYAQIHKEGEYPVAQRDFLPWSGIEPILEANVEEFVAKKLRRFGR